MRSSIDASPYGELAGLLEHRFGVARAVPVSRAALGLTIVLECWRERHGTCRVALPGAVCHEVVVAVLAAGCQPLFCDVDPANGLVTDLEWARARAHGASVAIVVHLYGNPVNIEGVRKLFCAPDCLLIDDAAQALGSHSEFRAAGVGGDIGLLSFGPTKHISTGNAALLFKSALNAEEFATRLRSRESQSKPVRDSLALVFRERLETARTQLRSSKNDSIAGFRGLLDGLQPLLDTPFSRDAEAPTAHALEIYSETAQARVSKKDLWLQALDGTQLQAVGMGSGCIPWRYVCRSPGISWSEQHRISEMLRAAGMHVSNWYIPAHWFLGWPTGTLPGVEKLAKEVFQFWLDESMTPANIAHESRMVRRLMP